MGERSCQLWMRGSFCGGGLLLLLLFVVDVAFVCVTEGEVIVAA